MSDTRAAATDGRPRVRRELVRPPDQRPAQGSAPGGDDLSRLVAAARGADDLLGFLDRWCWDLSASGLPVARVTVSIGTLHPRFVGFGARWTQADGRTEETEVGHEVRASRMYLDSPFFRVFERGETVRRKLEPAGVENEFPVLADLKRAGMTEYVALPLLLGRINRNAVTYATDRPGGFSEDEFRRLEAFGPVLSMALERLALRGIATTLLDVYLGRGAGARVLAGEIERGSGEAIRAVIWIADLRGYTRLSDRLPAPRVIDLLNRLFERQVAAVDDAGGEVLKFVGDGLLAIFPIADVERAPDACARALAATAAATEGLARLNAELAGEPDALALATVTALHVGEVFFGNIGGATRLDFTAIGAAVNLASRLELLAKRLERRVIASADFVAAAGPAARGFLSLGFHPLRGFAEPMEAFAPP